MEESLDALRPTESPAETVPSSEPETIATATTESTAEEAVPAPEEVTRVPNPYADSFLAQRRHGRMAADSRHRDRLSGDVDSER